MGREEIFDLPRADFTRKIVKMQFFEKIVKIQGVTNSQVSWVSWVSAFWGAPSAVFRPLPAYYSISLYRIRFSRSLIGFPAKPERDLPIKAGIIDTRSNFKKKFLTPIFRK